jgi:hypothetical protein
MQLVTMCTCTLLTACFLQILVSCYIFYCSLSRDKKKAGHFLPASTTAAKHTITMMSLMTPLTLWSFLGFPRQVSMTPPVRIPGVIDTGKAFLTGGQ